MAGERTVGLSILIARLPDAQISGDRASAVTGIETSSQAVRPGGVFVALRGTHTDGHRYVPQAIAAGARAVVVDATYPEADASGVTVIRVADTRRALSALSGAFFGDPSHSLDVIGITGTNGKTTTSRMIAAILNEGGVPCGVVGTVGAEFGDDAWQLGNTTPLPPELHASLARMRDSGARAVAMEVSSHALALDRVEDVRFRVAVLTNVTRDHLDFHQTLEAYAAAKRRLFAAARACVLNADDVRGVRWAAELAREGRDVVTYGSSPGATLAAQEIEVLPDGSRFRVDGAEFVLHLPGRFNVWNALAALGAARHLDVDATTAARALASLQRVAGRMEHVRGDGIDVVVDYAHTPDALTHALESLRETARGAVTLVFGCGGDRDQGKRSEMGAVAARLADRIIVTNDNPRSEDPRVIAKEIVAGMAGRAHVIELDRRRAIERAVGEAHPGDVVLIAGKGHEAHQIIGDRVLPFDDAAVARAALSLRSAPR
ncbi:MAG: UDP-N-acetylmuramoyl-L-alanyl-D-glutamate--2,6-diaminopimelate ligase [Candidatus Eremiobacteraeota bacterium]|nr:UDP-N-acetylmuramoyl-L-alanyl-D-glutamate--2,6-diaminopimelate ligase [Candidatus Eremiobacteraeota bacterium]